MLKEKALQKAVKAISSEVGLLNMVLKLPRLNNDPKMVSYGIWPSDTQYLNGQKFEGRSSGCGFEWTNAILSTIGETVERYAPAFYNINESVYSSYDQLQHHAVPPSEYALFCEEQYEEKRFRLQRFTNDLPLHWFKTTDLTNGQETWCPGQFIYIPFPNDKAWVTLNTSTGLAAHSNYYKAILTALYETIERDAFVIAWSHNLVTPKIVIDQPIQQLLDQTFPKHYDWHFFDISFDLEVPSVLGICFGEAEYGKFVAVGASTRATYGAAIQKVVQEIGQGVPYFRYLLNEKKQWTPSDDFNEIQGFEAHSIFYTKRPDLCHVFDKWKEATPTKYIDLYQENPRTDANEIKHIVQLFKDKNYNVLFKDITTPDIRQLGYYSIKVFVPQLIQLSGAYPTYYWGAKRLYEVPPLCGYPPVSYETRNIYPHPFP